jgi:protein TonB
MKTKKNQPESFEEIIFKNRNKAYGAFLLRKSYSRTVTVAAIITLFVFSFLVSWAMWSVKTRGMGLPPDRYIPMDTTMIIDIDQPPDLPPEKELHPPAKTFFKPVVVDSAIDNTIATQGELEGNTNTSLPLPDDPGKTDSVVIRPDPVPLPDPEKVFISVEEKPEFPGGDTERVKFLINNLTYPLEAKEVGVSGTVYLGFVVERDGSISNITLLRGIGGGCDEEAIRVVKMMPKWKPGMQQGHEVRVQFMLPIKFTLH